MAFASSNNTVHALNAWGTVNYGYTRADTQSVGSKILVVEDDAAIRDMLNSLLSQEGFDIVTADTGGSALELVRRSPIDLVVLDVMLPDVTGYEVCKRLRRRNVAWPPIVMLTALGAHEQVLAGLALGADDYLAKPFDPRELILRVGGLLRRSQQARTAERALSELVGQEGETRARADAAEIDIEVERTLRREFMHNVTTHMGSLSRVADVAVRRFPAGPLREVVEQLRMRIRSAALMYEITATLHNDPIDAYELIQIIARSLKDLYRPWRRVVVEVRGPSLPLPATMASSVALILNELVTNCLRHAFPEMRYGTVAVTYGEETGRFVFAIVDDGVGFDPAKPGAGRGRQAVETLTRELGGTITWTSGTQGTRAQGWLPLNVAVA